MKRFTLLLVLLGFSVAWMTGCKVSDKGTPLANQPPTTTLTHAPQRGATVNHYINLSWSGNDIDGTVTGYLVTVGDSAGPVSSVVTTSTDTSIAFPAPVDSVRYFATFTVQAIDNEGAMAPITAANTDTFFTLNSSPAVLFDASSVPAGSNVGTGFKLTLKGADPNPSGLDFCVSIDDTEHWTCSTDSIFIFGSQTLHVRDSDVTLVGVDDDNDGRVDEELENGIDDDHDGLVDEDTKGLIPDHTVLISNARLTPDSTHIIYARAIDLGGAISPIISRSFHVQSGRVPTLDTTVTGTYAGRAVYPDGSTYFERTSETSLVWEANALQYRGEINGYRHQTGDSAWSDWSSAGEIIYDDLPVGDYEIHMVARDLSGTPSPVDTFTLHIVEQHLSTNIVIVDETRNGTGQRGSPSDQQVDDFYDALFAGLNVSHVDYTNQGYVSPLNIKDSGLIMWHSDDKAELRFADNTRVLGEFLSRGGRVIASGWDLMGGLSNTADSVFFVNGSFGYSRLRLQWAVRNTPRTSNGLSGDNGYPGCQIDTAKVPANWGGTIDRTWTFRPRGEAQIIGRLTTIDAATNPLAGDPAAYVYDLSYRIAIFGVPLYFCYQDQVYTLFRNPNQDPAFQGIVDRMLQGLSAD